MRLYSMDNLVIDIYNIRNIEYINISDILIPNSSKMEVIPSLFINYDGGKTINLCSRDKYFDTFVRKVVEVYNDEKNNILEDNLTDPFRMRRTIQIDKHTKDILERGTLTEINDLYKFYSDKSKYNNSLLFVSDEFVQLIPIIKYHIKELFVQTDKHVEFEDKIMGYTNNFMFSGNVDGIFKYFPVIFDKVNDNEYIVQVGGLLESNTSITVSIKFNKDSIIVNTNIDKYNIVGTFTYLISKDVIKEIRDIKKEDVLVYYKNNDLKECDNQFKNITNFDQDTNLVWFKLPWGAIYGINNSIENISETEKIIKIYNMYLDCFEDSFIKKEYFSRSYKRNDTSSLFSKHISLDEAIKNTTCLCLNKEDGIYIMETSFLDTIYANGYYDEKLKQKYFYHLFQAKGIKEFTKEGLINIKLEDSIIDKSDILNDSLILKLVRGK